MHNKRDPGVVPAHKQEHRYHIPGYFHGVKLDWQNIVINLSQFLYYCTFFSQTKSEQRANMPSVFTDNDDKDYVSLKKPGCVASWQEGTNIIETFYNEQESPLQSSPSPSQSEDVPTSRRTELKCVFANLHHALCRQDVAVEHHVLNNVMKGDKRMFKQNKYSVREYKRKHFLRCMSGKENTPLPTLTKELIALATDIDMREDPAHAMDLITICIIVIDDVACDTAPQHGQSFEVRIAACSIGARLMDHCLSKLNSPPHSCVKLSFDERGVIEIHREHKLVDQGIRHNDRVFVRVHTSCDKKEWIETLYTSGNDAVTTVMQDMHFVKLYNGWHKMGCVRAESNFFNALKEKEILHSCDCPYIVRPVVTVLDESVDVAMSITLLYPEGDAFDVFTDTRAPFATHKALWDNIGACALPHLYRLGFQHGDVKLENIMYRIDGQNRPRFYLTDCEYSGYPGLDVKHSSGTPNYSSPERISFPPKKDAKCDGWSFALTIIAAWCKCLFQITSLDSAQVAGRCRVHIEACVACRVALVLDSTGENACVCRSTASYYQPLIKQTIADMIAICFERFALEMGEGFNGCFPNTAGGAEKACEMVAETLNGLLTIKHEDRYGPDMVRALN